MTNFDMTPLYRSTIGFDRLANIFDAMSASEGTNKAAGYPPYNVERLDDTDYRISMAVAGFAEDELDVEQVGTSLSVRGVSTPEADDDARHYLYRGIARTQFRTPLSTGR